MKKTYVTASIEIYLNNSDVILASGDDNNGAGGDNPFNDIYGYNFC